MRSYLGFVRTATAHGLITILRRKNAIFAGLVVLSPVIIPLAAAVLTRSAYGHEGNKMFVQMMEGFYLKALAPVLALFFGIMLIGEDVESQTIPYLLTRPLPRFALVLGRFVAFVLVSAGMLLPSVLLTFAACTVLGNFGLSAANAQLMLHYCGCLVMALMGYGAFCMFVGALARQPMIMAIVFMFGWQRLALYVPGLVDFLTIEKYVRALLPVIPTEREKIVMRTALAEFQKTEFLIGALKGGLVLVAVTAILLALTAFVIRWREYSQARAMEA